MGREGRHAHRHDGALRRGEWPDRTQELIGPRPVDHAENRVSALRQAEGPLPAILGLLVALDESATDESVDEPARGRRGPADLLGQLADGHRAAIGQDVQRRELREPEPQLTELAGEPDDQLPPQGTAHGHALADLADVRQAIARGQDGRGEVRLELAGDGLSRDDATADRDRLLGHAKIVGRPRLPCNRARELGLWRGCGLPSTAMTSFAYVFPGQGSQSVGMGRELAERSAGARATFDAADAALGEPLAALTWEGPAERLDLTENAQPAILATSIAILTAMREAWAAAGVPEPLPAFAAGHRWACWH